MARTRGAKSSSPSSRKRAARETPVQGSTSTPPQPVVVPHPVEPALLSHPARRYQTRSGGRSPQKKAMVVESEPIDLTELSLEPSPAPSSEPPAEPQPSQPPPAESQIPSGMAPEVLIRRPMVAQPPIEGNLDCRARPFHSELCFNTTTFRFQPELRDSFHLLQRYHMEHLLTPRDFFYPRVVMDFYQSMTTHQAREPTVIHFTIDGRHEEHPTNPYLLRKELPPGMFFIDALLHHNIYPLQHWVQRRGILLEALFRISEEYFFGPHHLIMAALLYFEEKVHRKKLLKADVIPLLFLRLLSKILEHLGYPSDPQLERRHICREVFTLNKWTNMTAYRAEHPELPQPQQPEEPQPAEIPTGMRAPTEPIPEGAPSVFPATPSTPPVIPVTSEPSTSSELRIAIPISEYRALCHTLQTLTTSQDSLAQEMTTIRAHQKQILATQTQYTTILRQLQHHLGIPSAIEHITPTTTVPTSEATEPHDHPHPTTEDAETST
ncbi:hypothetical protein CK203_061485 [Vitis vinifera]|uniref:Uncharacterized protein n=1 Tax=Vitis vinifera TaxID=29760 RepID=A0A438GFV2_VITVI|nr:hypothetical protein CK203_061485 [Vitis vinifera]